VPVTSTEYGLSHYGSALDQQAVRGSTSRQLEVATSPVLTHTMNRGLQWDKGQGRWLINKGTYRWEFRDQLGLPERLSYSASLL